MMTRSLLGCVLKLFLISIGTLIFSSCEAPYSFELSGNNFTFPIDPQTIYGDSDINGDPFDFTFPILIDDSLHIKPNESKKLDSISAIYLNTLAIRSLTAADFDQNHRPIKKRLMDPTLLNACEPGQQSLDFIESIEIWIKKNSQESQNSSTKIAHFSNVKAKTCSIIAEIDIDPDTNKAVNLKNFLPDYSVTLKAKGTSPETQIPIAGFVSNDFVVRDQNVFN